MAQPTVKTGKTGNAKGAIVKGCNCKNLFQDERYGKGQRLHCLRAGGGSTCTICGVKKETA